MIEGQTNVRSSRFGAGAIDGIGKELGRFVVTTMEVPWQRAQPRIGAPPAAGIRRGHRVEYVGQTSPDPLVIDYDLIRTAPAELNIAGVGDLLSIHTACFDWELASRAGRSEFPYRPEDVAAARAILADTMVKAKAIRDCSDDGLRAIVEGYMRVNTLCLPAGHYRVEEGSEHYLFYELEERLQRPFIHGWIVGLGVHLLSRLQENRHAETVDFMGCVGLRYQPTDLGIGRDDLMSALLNLRHYVESRRDLWHTIIQERSISPAWIQEALGTLKFNPDL